MRSTVAHYSGEMRLAVGVAIGALALVSGSAVPAAPALETSLVVTYWPEGDMSSKRVRWTLRCDPAGGTLPRPARACAKLAAGGVKLFAPIPPNTACTEIYGGPQKARVVGVVGGKRVWASFSRENGCHIGRWQRLSPWLLPPGGVS